ncbi:TPA: hypothetical protein L4559_003431 [Pseudomonas aeruginosa]|nr:hypothetical protein [Pseudomonas aeruginosa]
MTAIPHPLDPRIGVLMRHGAPVFYAFHQGNGADPVEGTLQEVETVLGLPSRPPLQVDANENPQAPAKPLDKLGRIRRYAVTVTPSVTLYSGSLTFGETVEHVEALNRRDAEKQVRQQLRDANGQYGPKYNVVARLADD